MRPARLLAATMTSALVLAGMSALAVPAAAQSTPDPAAAAERELRAQSSGKVTVRRDERGVVHFVGTEPGKPARRPAQVAASASAAAAAGAHLARYGALWRLDHKGVDARSIRTLKGPAGQSVVRFQQTVQGMPVLGGELSFALDGSGNLQSVNGETTPLALRTAQLSVSEERARETAVRIAARANDLPEAALRAGEAQAYAYDAALLGPATKNELAPVWRVEVIGPPHVRHLVLVDRERGNVPLHFNQVAQLFRLVCDRKNEPDTTGADGYPTLETCVNKYYARIENQAATGEPDVDAAYDYTGHTAQFFESDDLGISDLTELIGHDTGHGKRLRSTVNYCFPVDWDPNCPMQDAFWNGEGVFYGAGTPQADDIVAHELTHGVIQHTSNLAYFYQSGAINESMSDVFGELVDLTNPDDEVEDPWKMGEDSPFGVVRDLANPPAHGDPDRMQSALYADDTVHSPSWDNGGVHTNSGVGNKAAHLIAEPGTRTFNGQTITGLGYTKAKRIYFKALQTFTSGSDYEDLYSVLPQACDNLAAAGAGGITALECTNTVRAAVTATEMNLQPITNATAPEAPVCDSGTRASIFTDYLNSKSNWSTTSGMWHVIDNYAKGGKGSLYGWEPAREFGEPKYSYARLAKSFTIPSGAPTYLRFDHQYLLAHDQGGRYLSGARVEYSVSGGTWQSASASPWANGPTRTIMPRDSGNYRAFGGDSHGYQSSRLDVSSLAGKSVQFRWRIQGDPEIYFDGWTLDNVMLYSCGGATPTNVRSVTPIGSVTKATVKWPAPLWPGEGGLTKYTVTAKKGDTVVQTYDVAPTATSKLVSGLSRGTSYQFYVQPHSAGGQGPYSTRALIGTTLHSALSPTTIYSGQSVKFSGKLVRVDSGAGVRGLKVYLQGRKKGHTTWKDITSMSSGTGGAYSFTHKPTSSWEYRSMYKSGSSSYMGTFSNTRAVTVR